MSSGEPKVSRTRRVFRFLFKTLAVILLLLVVAVIVGTGWGWWSLKGSLPTLEGESELAGLTSPVTIERDALGVPTLRGENRLDVARATGFVHGQDRFFQMDLFRRRATGELAGVFGQRARKTDMRIRLHRLGEVSRQALAADLPENRALAQAYAEGVNAGLGSLSTKPFEYYVARAEPEPWKPEDSYAVLLAMFLQVQGENAGYDADLALLQECLSPALFDYLTPRGTEWDAAIDGTQMGGGPLPGPEGDGALPSAPLAPAGGELPEDGPTSADTGSNAWAVAGSKTADGRALIANDMHLGLTVPNIWYRASFAWTGTGGEPRRMTGLTLPGAPVMVTGSNGRIAWGFTNAQIDNSDLIVWETDEADDETYLTPEGREPYARHEEVLRFKGGEEETFEVLWTRWGPVLEDDHLGRKRVARWVGHDPRAVNLRLSELEQADNVDDAVAVANHSGLPAQNMIVADHTGRIAWTIAGILPRRVGFDGRLPGSWAHGERTWDGWLEPEEYPRIVDPESGLLWSANNRMVGGEMLEVLGDGSYVLAARASQIRDRLHALTSPDEKDMLALQLDDEALFLKRWHELLVTALTPEAAAGDPRRAEARELLADWNGRADPDSVGYRLVRRFRIELARQVFGHLTQACHEIEPDFVYRTTIHFYEGPLWQLVQERPRHLLAEEHATWDDQLLAGLDGAIEFLTQDEAVLAEQTWGERNTLRIRHPLSGLPVIGSHLKMPAQKVSGDNYMPKVQHPNGGASERMVVSPGREADGIFHMPTGQSGHPLSPHFDDHQQAWVEGQATPFLPGEPVNTYVLRPPG